MSRRPTRFGDTRKLLTTYLKHLLLGAGHVGTPALSRAIAPECFPDPADAGRDCSAVVPQAPARVREAACSCGAVRVRTEGVPIAVVACHCTACQRRTGSVLGVGAYFARERVTVSGASVRYARPGTSGHEFVTHFCPTCATSTHWTTAYRPDTVGVAVGAFADPEFPAPTRSVWERSRHAWLDLGAIAEHFPGARP